MANDDEKKKSLKQLIIDLGFSKAVEIKHKEVLEQLREIESKLPGITKPKKKKGKSN